MNQSTAQAGSWNYDVQKNIEIIFTLEQYPLQ